AVLEAVEGDHGHAPAAPQAARDGEQGRAQAFELPVDADAQRLEGARGRVEAVAARGTHGAADDRPQLARAGDRSALPSGQDGPRDAAGEALLAELVDEIGELFRGKPVDQVGRSLAAAAIHAHVEGAFPAEAEAPLRVVELLRAHAEVEQHSVRSL